jgi:hypothetical protein
MSNPTNIANRLRAGVDVAPDLIPKCLLSVASEATARGIQDASAMLLRAWAGEVKVAAGEMEGGAEAYWLSIANELEDMAHKRCTGVLKS